MMRPDAEADGLICILAQDYSIVKIKKSIGYSVAIINNQLSVNAAPILTSTCPLFRYVLHSKIQHFEKAVICREYGLCFGHFLQLTVKSFNGIYGINQFS